MGNFMCAERRHGERSSVLQTVSSQSERFMTHFLSSLVGLGRRFMWWSLSMNTDTETSELMMNVWCHQTETCEPVLWSCNSLTFTHWLITWQHAVSSVHDVQHIVFIKSERPQNRINTNLLFVLNLCESSQINYGLIFTLTNNLRLFPHSVSNYDGGK